MQLSIVKYLPYAGLAVLCGVNLLHEMCKFMGLLFSFM